MFDEPEGKAKLSPEEEQEVWRLLHQVRDVMIRLRDREVRHLGITSMQGGVLWVVKSLQKTGKAATPAEISRWLFRQPPTIQALLKRMEKLGLVTCTDSASGRRQTLVELTDRGRQTYLAYMRKREAIPRVIGALSLEERQLLKSSLAKLRQKAGEELASMQPHT